MAHRFLLSENETANYFVIVLLEQDSHLSAAELTGIVDHHISFAQLPAINKAAIQSAIGDDDLLGATVIKLSTISNNKNTKTKIEGIHLFDEYVYWLYWRGVE